MLTALDRTLQMLAEQAPRAVGSVIKSGAQSLCDDDEHFWSRVRRVCGEEFVGTDLIDIQTKLNKIRDLEITRHRQSHWTYDAHRHMAAIQLSVAVSHRCARQIQEAKYGRSYL